MEAQIAKYLEAKLPAASVTITNLLRIPGGASRETWMFDAMWENEGGEQSQSLVLRKDPPASLLDTDRELEYAFYSTFWATKVPVPRMRWLEQDASVLGGPFFIMDRIVGCEVNTRLPQTPAYQPLQPVMAKNLYDILGEIATHDWTSGPVAKLLEPPSPEESWQRELGHWEAIIDAEELSPQPVTRAAIRWLRANPPPPAQRISVVHGDFRVGNFLYQPDASIHGVLDWEMAHLGDPIEDLAYSFNESWWWARDGRPGGIVDRETAIRLWEEASGLKADPAAVHWWELFNSVKLQGIWLKSARVFQDGQSSELIHLLCAYGLINSQDQAMLHTMGRAT
jgi:aminoglycoside phosphotransferase (APT) family kinase protein